MSERSISSGAFNLMVKALRPLRFPGKGRLLEKFIPREGEVVAKILGFKMRLDLTDHVQRWIYFGNFERKETWWAKSWLQPGMTVVDVGANVGYYTLLAASCVGPTGKVYAVEPSPYAYARLLQVVTDNAISNVVTLQVALGSVAGDGVLYPPRSGNHSPSMVRKNEESEGTRVSVKTLDECLKEWGVSRVDLLKIDVEGFELLALVGAQAALKSGIIRAILCELNDWWLRKAGGSAKELYQLIESAGFTNPSAPPSLQRNSFNSCFFIHNKAHS